MTRAERPGLDRFRTSSRRADQAVLEQDLLEAVLRERLWDHEHVVVLDPRNLGVQNLKGF